jgi:hypothetical protein
MEAAELKTQLHAALNSVAEANSERDVALNAADFYMGSFRKARDERDAAVKNDLQVSHSNWPRGILRGTLLQQLVAEQLMLVLLHTAELVRVQHCSTMCYVMSSAVHVKKCA